jgi:hypothetical protein
LIKLDALELAERVCFSLGQDRIGAREAADVVTMHRIVLAIRVGDFETARSQVERIHSKSLSMSQLEEIENAIKSRSKLNLRDLKNVHELYLINQIEIGRRETLGPSMGYVPMGYVPDGEEHVGGLPIMSSSAHQLIGKALLKRRPIPPVAVLSSIQDDGPDDPIVCIETPRIVSDWEPAIGFRTIHSNQTDMEELLFYCDKYGEPGCSVYFLGKSGNWSEAIDRALSVGLPEKVFVTRVSQAASTNRHDVWISILQQLVDRTLCG